MNAGEAQKAEKETAVAVIDRGWKVSKSAGDAAEWNADDLSMTTSELVNEVALAACVCDQ